MQILVNEIIDSKQKEALASKVKPRSSATLRASIVALIDEENKRVPAERQISQRTAFTVASRSLNKTAKLEKKSRIFAAYREVASFVSLAIDGKTPISAAKHTDLLPVGHPLSSASHAMTASAYSHAVARWIAADPRIDDSVREIVASAFAYPTDSIEHVHATERLVALTASGVIPQELIISLKTEALVAAFGDGNSSAARSARAKTQRRDRKGRFAEQGGGMQFYFRTATGNIKSIVGKFVANSDKSEGFQVEIKNDENIEDGLYDIPAIKSEALKAILPGDGSNPDVQLPAGVEAVDAADLSPLDAPAGFTLVSEKNEGESGPDKVFQSADGYRVEYFKADNPDKKAAVQKAWTFNTGAGSKLGNPPSLVNSEGVYSGKLNSTEPVYIAFRDTPEAPKKSVAITQSWADTQNALEKDAPAFDKAVADQAENNAKLEKSKADSKAADEAFEKKAEDVMKANEELRQEIDANIANGLDQFGNKVPAGWEMVKDEDALNPQWSKKIGDKEFVTTSIKKEDAVFFKRTEQGIEGQLYYGEDGKLKGLYMGGPFENWDAADTAFGEFVEQSVNNKREAALDAIELYDESGEIRSMIENGATPQEVLEKLDENPDWKTAKDDFDTQGFVDLPQKAQKDKWAAFGKKLDAIYNMPPEFTPIEKSEAKAELPATKKPGELKVGDVVMIKGEPKKIDKISSVDSGDMISFDNGKKFKIFEDPNEDVQLAPDTSPKPKAKIEKAKEPIAELPEEAPASEPVAVEKLETTGDWILPEGAYNLYKPEEYEPEGNLGNDSPDYTDDPKVLAKKFTTDDLTSALLQALRGKKSAVDELLAELDKIVDDEENTGKPGPKKKDKNKKVEQASGYGSLEFSEGDEYVPAEAIYNALNEQGEDAKQITAEIYDLGSGESKNADLISGLNKEESVGQQEPTALIDALDLEPEDVKNLNAEIAKSQAASVATAQIEELVKNGETNETLKLIANDILNVDEPEAYEQLLKDNIGLALSNNESHQAAFRGLWGMMLSLDGGSTENGGSPTNLLEATRAALEDFNGTAEYEDAEDIFDRYGYFEDLIASKANIANQNESIDDPKSLAGNFYRLIAATTKPNDTALYRGIRLKSGEDLDAYTTEGEIISLDPRSFATNKMSAASFADALVSHDDSSVIFTIEAGQGQSVDVTDISMFGDENEQIVWGDYKIASVSEKPLMGGNGKLYNVKLEKMTERDSVLEGYSDNYENLLLTNDAAEMPGEYYTPGVDPYVATENGDGVPEEFSDSPLTIARMWDTNDLIEVFTGAIEDGSGKVLLEYPIEDGYEATVDVEAVRDALQIQGINTNAILADIANVEPGTEPDASTDEQVVAESNVDNIVDSIAGDISNEYDLEGWKQTGPQQGSNKGGTYTDAAGNEYYVKTPKSEQHAQNEVLASALYRAAGIDAAEFYIGSADDGEKKIYSPMIPGATPDLQDKLQDPEYKKKLQDGFAVDAWLANWDVAGLVFDNVVTNENGDPVRVDPGGALLYRAQGAPKGSLFGDKVGELDSLRNKSMNPQAASIFGDMTDEQQKESAAKLLDITPDDINTLVDSVITDEATATKLKDTLAARRQDILDRYGLTAEDTSITAENNKIEEPEAPAEVAPEPEAPAAPEPEAPAPADNVNNPYVTSDGVPIEPGMKLEHLKTGEIFDFIKYDKGNTSYVYVKDSEGKIKVKSTKQLKSVGNGGGETAPVTPETPSAPEPVEPAAPEAPSAPEATEPAPEPTPEGVTALDFDNELQPQIEKAIEEKSNLSFMYNGKAREITPQSVWTNPKNGNVNVYALDNADMQMKTFTISKIEPLPAGEAPVETVEAEAPEVAVPDAGETLDTAIPAPQTPPDGEITITSSDGTPVYKHIEIVDKNQNKGTILKVNQKDNYAFVQFDDGTTGWRSGKTISATGNLNTGVTENKTPKTGNAKTPKVTKKKAGKITPAGAEIVIVETPDAWDESNFDNVPSLVDAIGAAQSPEPGAAMRGASAAIDSDSIEDLDVRVMRVRDVDGNDGLRFKLKLTSWAGNQKAKELLAMSKEEANAQGITRTPYMKIDRIDVGPDGIGQVSKDGTAFTGNTGYSWTITTPDGISIQFNRANTTATNATAGGGGRAFHNSVQIQAPSNATPEQIANALSIAGVQDVRPATPADTKIWVENRLMSIFDGKVDATKNPKGEDREASLAKIKEKYGITTDDVVISTGASGRIETRLSAEGAKKLVEATNSPTAIQHNITIPWNVKNDGDEAVAELVANVLATPQGGLLSTTARWTEGIGANGMSSATDVNTGGADYVFTKPVKNPSAIKFGTTDSVVMYFDPEKLYERLDFYANSYDSYGKRQSNQDIIKAAQVGAYELMWKGRVSFDDMIVTVVPNQAIRTAVIAKLRQKGITEIGGKPLEAAITLGTDKENA